MNTEIYALAGFTTFVWLYVSLNLESTFLCNLSAIGNQMVEIVN